MSNSAPETKSEASKLEASRSSVSVKSLPLTGSPVHSSRSPKGYTALDPVKLARSKTFTSFTSPKSDKSDSPNKTNPQTKAPEKFTPLTSGKALEPQQAPNIPTPEPLFNESIISPTSNNQTRHPTVIKHNISNTGVNTFFNEISPLTDDSNSNLKSPNTPQEVVSHKSSSILNPFRHKKAQQSSTFSENPYMDFHERDESISIHSHDYEDSGSPNSNSRNRLKKYTTQSPKRTNFKLWFILSLGTIALLLGGFIPTTVILANGTTQSVRRFFRKESHREKVLPELLETYGQSESEYALVNSTSANISVVFPANVSESDLELASIMKREKLDLFYGIAYSPAHAMEPNCGMTARDTLLDIATLATVTSRIRNYGMQCNQSQNILDAIQLLKLNVTLAMGVWIGANDAINESQLASMKQVLRKYPESMFETIFVGNEVLFRQDKSTRELINIIKSVKAFLKSIGYNKIPVGTSEIGSLIDAELIENCDIIGANVHPFFGGGTVENAADWTLDFIKYQLEPLNPTKKQIAITEVGWPTSGGHYQKSVASLKNANIFMNSLICKVKQYHNPWYYFEAFDEPWKKVFYEKNNRWETEWGLFSKTRSSKFEFSKPRC